MIRDVDWNDALNNTLYDLAIQACHDEVRRVNSTYDNK